MSEMRNWWTTPRWEMDMSALTNEIAALRSQLAAEQSRTRALQKDIAKLDALCDEAVRERDEWENAAGVYEAGMVRAERERDEARRERDGAVAMLRDSENERDGWKHRAERAERVVEAARKWDEANANFSGACLAMTSDKQREKAGAQFRKAVANLEEAVRALDATPTRGSDE